jgi:hypothetical protein
MATRKAKKVSRRQLIIVLGSGALATGFMGQCRERRRPVVGDCDSTVPAEVAEGKFRDPKHGDQLAVMSRSCCEPTIHVLKAGFEAQGISETEKRHLKPLLDVIERRGEAPQYAFIAIGINDKQVEALTTQFQTMVS